MDKRDKELHFMISQSERERIEIKMKEMEIRSLSAYLRKMALDGYCVKLELDDVKEMVSLLRICSNNLNQYAKKAHAINSIYEDDIKDLENRLEEIWNVAKEIMLRLASI
ncbi:plasmid mobilization protein [Thomasclavelia ramosa]|jgi:hypothetical protein|uniref:plasmid mobilization protein n=1 Tax=Thomasclavelia ramosa TaxID=1547 RepID=UPI003F630330